MYSDKKTLRKFVAEKRKRLDTEKISILLIKKLIETKEYKNSKDIMIFYPLSNEINLLPLLEDKTKQFYLPRINGKELECCKYNIGDNLCESRFHTKEPICEACSKSNIDMVISPALACDKRNYRLGYGGGFYDKFLRDFNGIKICCVPSELIFDTVYPEEHDIKLDLIISEQLD